MPCPLPTSPRARGFTLIEIVVVLLVFGVVISMVAVITRGVVAGQKRSLTSTRMAGIDLALTQFVLQQKRLPCPADGTKLSSANDAGVEGGRTAAGCTGTLANGVVPWRALGLTETEATDGWERRLTYRVHVLLGADNGMDMSWCDPAGSEGGGTPRACNTACTATSLGNCTPPTGFLTGRGLEVRNLAGTVLMNPAVGNPHTGAAYVLISHGESGGGGYVNTGVLAPSTSTDGTEEQKNYANLALQAYYVDAPTNDVAGNDHFDDIVSRPAVLTVATKAGLGPRSH